MRILTRTQYDAICDIVMEQKKRIEELEADLEKRKEQVRNLEKSIKGSEATIDYLNDKLFKRTEQLMKFQGYCKSQGFSFPVNPRTHFFDLDFPATQKPEDKLF